MSNTLAFIGKRIGAGNSPIVKRFLCTLTGSYVAGGGVGIAGETLAFNNASNAGYKARPKIPNGGASGTLPANTDFETVTVPNGYSAQIEKNAANPTANNFIMRLFEGGSGAANPAELASNTYASYGLSGAQILIEVLIPAKYA